MPKTITLLASGTRGDVQPYIALGLGLQAAGYRVRVATHASFRALVERYGLPFALVEGNPSDLLTQPGGQSALTFDGNWLRSARATLDFLRAARPLYERMLASAWPACQGSDALVIGLATTWGVHIAESLKVPCLWCFLQPFSRTRDFPSALIPSTFSLGPVYNRLSYFAVEQATWQPWRAVINRWRREMLRLPSVRFTGPYSKLDHAHILYGFSPRVVPPPADWPRTHRITGYWFLPEPSDWKPSTELTRFLEAGSPPVYIGFGSPGTRRPLQALSIITRTLDASGLRAVMALPRDIGATLPPNILPIAHVPHAWLLPRMAAVVHHGGAGTTGTGLRTGVPTLIVPLAVDQFFWGKRVEALGVGPRPIPQRALDVDALAAALHQATHDAALRSRAQALGQVLQNENGIERAVKVIRSLV
jgi:sterol 3beta-glucosyltransferase